MYFFPLGKKVKKCYTYTNYHLAAKNFLLEFTIGYDFTVMSSLKHKIVFCQLVL